MARLADALTQAGHNVTFFTPIQEEAFRNSMGVKLTKDVIIVEKTKKSEEDSAPFLENIGLFWTLELNSSNGQQILGPFHEASVELCDSLLQNKPIIEELKNRKFYVAIAEGIQTCGLGLFEFLGIGKVVLTSSCVNYDILIPATGEPEETSYLPSMSSEVSDVMTFSERLENTKMLAVMKQAFVLFFDDEERIYKKHLGSHISGWRALIPAASLHLVNSNPFIDFPRPSLQKTVPIGGISVELDSIRSSKLPVQFENILDKRDRNVFIFFGSLAKSSAMPDNYRQNLLKVIKSQPNVTFIWKYETDNVRFADGIDNLAFVKWAPQTTLLNDKRLTAFITHGGLGSTNEVAYLGKPAIMVPTFADQARNSNMLARQGMAIALHKRDLGNFEKIRKAVDDILNNKSYWKNAERVSKMLQDQPQSPKEIAVKHIEFVGRYGPFPLMSPQSLKMPFYQRYNYDVYLFIGLTYIAPFVFIFFISVIFVKIGFLKVRKTD